MTTREFIICRKLHLFRAFTLRLGYAWPKRLRKAGFVVEGLNLCDSHYWDESLTKLEDYARAYGYFDPLDDLGPAKAHSERIRKVLTEDLKEAKLAQTPLLHPTAGGVENVAAEPASVGDLVERMAKAFGAKPEDVVLEGARRAALTEVEPTQEAVLLARLAAAGLPADRVSLHEALGMVKVRKPKAGKKPRVPPAERDPSKALRLPKAVPLPEDGPPPAKKRTRPTLGPGKRFGARMIYNYELK